MSEGPPIPFSNLPLDKTDDATYLNAWGLYGPDDELGFLNRQTDASVASAAASEIKTGIRVALDAPLGLLGDQTLFNRQPFEHNVYQKKPRIVHDDTWHLNTQSSTQWDGLRHFGYQKAARFYNNTTLEDIAGTSERSRSTAKNVLGIHNFVQRGGVTGRGILVDFARWASAPSGPGHATVMAETDGRGYRPFESDAIKVSWLKAALEHQGTQVKYGDVLIVRSGSMKAYQTISAETLQALQKATPPNVGGVEANTELFEWVWNNFSAVAGDQVGFEKLPMSQPISAHEVLLAGWGCPIGELFDLEALSATCEELGRWSFFFCSQPVHVTGGVASPPNAVAIF